jgi:predicted amidohydrolase
VHVVPTGPRGPSTARSTCSTSRSGGSAYRESEHEEPGEEVVVRDGRRRRAGLSICYDLRFPELYRDPRRARRAVVLIVPAAFIAGHHAEHWEVLLAARAIEDQGVQSSRQPVLGEARAGIPLAGAPMIVDQWGNGAWRRRRTPETFVIAHLDPNRKAEIRRSLPLPWPQPATAATVAVAEVPA